MNKYLILIIGFCLSFISLDLVAQNSIVVTAFNDADANGIDDDGFIVPGLTTAELFLTDGLGGVFNHNGDGGTGVYTFDNGGIGLLDQTYTLNYIETAWTPAATVPGNEVFAITLLNAGAPAMDNDVDPISGLSAGIVINAGPSGSQVIEEIDLGLYFVTAIGDFVWEDINGDGLQDGELGEGISGVTVTLLDGLGGTPLDTDGAPVNPETTDGTGNYQFGNLPPGDYIVQFSLPTVGGLNWYATTYNPGEFSNDSDANPNNFFQSSVFSNIDASGTILYTEIKDAGFVVATNIGDMVWEDLNGDGVRDPGDLGINGVTVSLFDAAGAPAIGTDGIAIAPQITANIGGIDGIYQFMLVPPGQYQVEFGLPAPIGGVDWYPTLFDPTDVEPDNSDTDSDASNNPADGVNYLRTAFITVESGETDEEMRIDAGFWLPAKIGNMVFCDRNGNGIHEPGAANPEAGVDGVTVSLLFSGGPNDGNPAIDADGNVIPPMTTAGGGFYEFELVPPGVYKVKFEFNATITDPPYVFTFIDAPGSTDTDDSDVNDDPTQVKYGETAEITIESRDTDEETKWDAGVFRLIDISGTVWFDTGMDQTNTGETGPGGVPMVLTEINGVYPPVNGASSTDGKYDFLGVPPGEYTLTITAAAFAAGGSLAGTASCPGSNDANIMTDNDDNGPDTEPGDITTTQFTVTSNCDPGAPPIVEYVDFCFEFDCGMESSISAGACDEINPINTICDVPTLEAFCNLMPTGNSSGTQPTPLCPTGGGVHNVSWFAFVAYDGNYSVTITPQGCTNAGGYAGVQIGLYTDCTFSETVYCNPNCSEDPVTFESDGSGTGQDAPLEPGQTYYFFIDGCAGSVCSYDVEIIGSPSVASIAPTDMCILDDTGIPDCTLDNVVACPGADVLFQVQGIDLTLEYTWSVNTVIVGADGPFSGDAAPMSTDENQTVTFNEPGTYEVCINTIDNGCSAAQWNGALCRTIVVQVIPDEMFSDQTVCLENLGTFNFDVFDPEDPNADGTLGWIANEPTPAFGTITGMVDQNGCMYEQEFELFQHPVSPDGVVDMTLCKEDLDPPLMIDGTPYTLASFTGNLTLELLDFPASMQDANDCDSLIDINLEILDIFMGEITQGPCLTEGIILTFEYGQAPAFPSTDESFITFEWTDPNGDVLDDNIWNTADIKDNIAPTDIGSGTYTLTATITKNGVTCIFPYTIDIDFSTLIPPMPTIAAPVLMICESDSIQTYTGADFGNADTYIWTVLNGVIVSGGEPTDQTIEINWAGNATGSLSLAGSNGCGEGDATTIDITLVPLLTPDFTVTAEVCQDSSSVIEFSGDATDIDSYIWDFDGGTINNATGGTGPGPHEVSWSDGGVAHTITLTVMHNSGCTSIEQFDVVNTIAPLTPPVVNCNPATGEISFTWDDVTGATGYDVVVTSTDSDGDLHTGTIAGNTFTVTGLDEGETVTIQLIIFTGDACQMVVGTAPGCTSQNCDAPVIELDAGNGAGALVSICTDDIVGNITIESEVTSGESGTGMFSGTGIVDGDAGTFDPSLADIGLNTITYIYMTNDPVPCIGNQTIQIEILETPTALFSPSMDTVCITDAVTLNYQGTAGINSSSYTASDGQTFNSSDPQITFTQTGLQTITLTVIKDGCESTEYTDEVFVQPELEQIDVNCITQELDNVAFEWNAIAGATGYSVTVTNADLSVDPPFITTDLTYAQGGLDPGDVISITVEVISDSRCPGSSDSAMCTASDCPTVNVTIDAGIPLDYCVDGTNGIINLTAGLTGTGDGSGDFVWSGDGVTGTQFDPNGLPEGPVTINVEYTENGCGGYSDDIILNILQRPTATFDVGSDPICIGSTIPITFTGSNLPGQVIDWAGSDVTVTATTNPNEYEATFDAAGTFDIIVNVANGTNCSAASAPSTITVEPELVFGDVDCLPSETEVSFSWAAVDCATDYEVFITIGLGAEMSQGIQSTTTYVEDNLPEGTEVSIRVVAISDCACDDVMMTRSCETSACIQASVDVSAMGGVTDFCFATDLATVDVLAELTDNTTDGSGSYSGTGVDPVSGTFDPSAAGVGTHTILYTWIEPLGCEPFLDSVTFTIFENPEVTAMADPIDCYEDSLTMLNIVPINGDGNYTITSEGDDIPLMSEVMVGTYDILVTDGNGCTAETSETITIPAEPMPTITGSTELIVGETSNYTIEQSIFTGLAIDSVVWTANGTVICNEVGCFSISNEAPVENTTYEVTVFYNNGCSVVTSLDVEVTDTDPIFTVDIPNIISPNGDGENDEWMVVTGDPEVIVSSVQVMDRWGNLVFEIAAPYSPLTTAIIWDGKFGTTELQPGVYVYSVRYTQDGRDRVRNGDITIIR